MAVRPVASKWKKKAKLLQRKLYGEDGMAFEGYHPPGTYGQPCRWSWTASVKRDKTLQDALQRIFHWKAREQESAVHLANEVRKAEEHYKLLLSKVKDV